jgi:hypothetical protein
MSYPRDREDLLLTRFAAIEQWFLPIVCAIAGRAKPFMDKPNRFSHSGQVEILTFDDPRGVLNDLPGGEPFTGNQASDDHGADA